MAVNPIALFNSFYPRTPRGVRRLSFVFCIVESTFLSTHPSRSATGTADGKIMQMQVSIHAPLAECDRTATAMPPVTTRFYPRTPRGVRPETHRCCIRSIQFLSTHPSRSATIHGINAEADRRVSIHAPLAECDYRQGY